MPRINRAGVSIFNVYFLSALKEKFIVVSLLKRRYLKTNLKHKVTKVCKLSICTV